MARRTYIGRIISHGLRLNSIPAGPPYGVEINIGFGYAEDTNNAQVDVRHRDPEDAEYFGYSMVRIALEARMHNIQQVAACFRDEGGQTDVHTEHCCERHGCKYGAQDCSVTTQTKPQSFICEACGDELDRFEQSAKDLIAHRNARMEARRNRASRERG